MDAIRDFENGRLPEPFGHHAHLQIAWLYLRELGALAAMERFPAALKRTVQALGAADKYNHTQTMAWLVVLAERLDDSPTFEVFLERHPELGTNLVGAHYGDALHSPRAKQRFVTETHPGYRYEAYEGRSPEDLTPGLKALHDRHFRGDFEAMLTIQDRQGALLWVARDAGALVGFKLGYAKNPVTFHSCMGAVHDDHRGRGVARALMRHQHDWLRERGFTRILTETLNVFRPMLMLNLSEGFDIVGSRTTRDGEPQIQLEKRLDGPGFGPETYVRPGTSS